MSNVEIKSGDNIALSVATNNQPTLKVKEGAVNIAVTGVSASKDAHHTHNQNSASDSWSVAHNLGKKPSVVIVDSADTVLYGHIEYTDLNNLTITLSAPTSGKAYIN